MSLKDCLKRNATRIAVGSAVILGCGREAFLASHFNDMVIREPRDPKNVFSGYLPGGRAWVALDAEMAMTAEKGPVVNTTFTLMNEETGQAVTAGAETAFLESFPGARNMSDVFVDNNQKIDK